MQRRNKIITRAVLMMICGSVLMACSYSLDSEGGIITLTPSSGVWQLSDESSPTSQPTRTASQTLSPTLTSQPTDTSTPTTTMVPSATPIQMVRFAIIGDFGLAGDPVRDVTALIKSWNPDFILTTGDNNYPDGSAETMDENVGQYFHEFIFPYLGGYGSGANQNRFFPVLGNHDWNSDKAKPYFDYFTLPGNERYYDFIWGPVHFFAVDSDSREPDGVGRSSLQAQWLRDQLAASTASWKIVYMHHPPYSSIDEGPIDWIQWPFKEWGATVVISGHGHGYERIERDGFTYFVNGLGGGPIYGFIDLDPGSQLRFRDDYGAMKVEATQTSITFEFITRNNQVVDTWTIHAGD